MATEEQIREAFIDEARAELGATQGKADPGRVSGYRREVGLGPNDGKHWCGIFALAMGNRSGLLRGVKWKLGSGFCEAQRMPKVRTPKPGDIAVYGAPNWHHAIVTAVDVARSTFDSIDGNQGSHPPRDGEVTIKERKGISLRKVFAFYSVEDFVKRRLEELGASEALDVEEDTKPETPETKADTQPPAAEPTLKVGDTGEWVQFLQKTLTEKGVRGVSVRPIGTAADNTELVELVPDGAFGPVTESAVARFQAASQLVIDGVVGPRTWNALLRE